MKRLLTGLQLLLISTAAFSQNADSNFNEYYRFPLSLGVEYLTLQPVSAYREDFSILDFSGQIRYPLPNIPTIQPFIRGGLTRFDSTELSDPLKWDHYQIYGQGGAGYASRFAKNFELGADFQLGLGQAVFPNAVDSGTVGSLYWQAQGAAKISLDPSYALSIDIKPTLRYQRSIQPFDKYDGWLAGLGFAIHFRFGEDPDRSEFQRYLRFDNIEVDPVFAAMQSYYVDSPIGRIELTNTSRMTVSDVQISFMQAGYMDSPTVAGRIGKLAPGESASVDLKASYNGQIFTTNGITPLTGEVIAEYTARGRSGMQKESVTYDLHDKTAITWDDDRKVGAFITPADSALQNYVSFIRKAAQPITVSHWSRSVQTAMQIYAAMGEIGIIYQIDPISPFTRVQTDSLSVDSVKLSRDTLIRGTGDCDDLTVLFCSLMEAAGLETGFITVPGHIYPAINTGFQSRQFGEIHPDRDMTLDIDGELWLPLEITMVDSGSFLDAWFRGADLWKSFGDSPELRGFYRTRKTQELYRPVGLRESDLGLQYGDAQRLAADFRTSLNSIGSIVSDNYARIARETGEASDFNRAGMVYAKFGLYSDAETYLNRALRIDKDYLPALINLGNISYMQENYPRAIGQYQSAYDGLGARGMEKSSIAAKLLINMSKASHEADEYDQARLLFAQAREVDPQLATPYAYLGSTGGLTRASDMSAADSIIFIEEE